MTEQSGGVVGAEIEREFGRETVDALRGIGIKFDAGLETVKE